MIWWRGYLGPVLTINCSGKPSHDEIIDYCCFPDAYLGGPCLSVFTIIILYSTPFLYTVTLVFILMHTFLIIIYQKNWIISYYFSYFDVKRWSKSKIFNLSLCFFFFPSDFVLPIKLKDVFCNRKYIFFNFLFQ
jgi:hypothetical protein